MPQTMETLNAVAKEVYQGSLNKQLNDEVVALKRVKKSGEGIETNIGGKYVVFAIHTRRNTGIGARKENEALPRPGQQGYAAGRVGLKYQYGAVQLTGQAIRLINEKPQSFISAVEQEMTRLKDDLANDLNRQCYGDGSGSIGGGITAAAASAATVEVLNAYNFDDGMRVDVLTPGANPGDDPSAVIATGLTVETADIVDNTVTFDQAVTVSVGDVIVRSGNFNREWTGFGAIVNDDNVLYDIDPATERVWKSVVNDNGGVPRAVSEGLFNTVTDQVKINGGRTTVGLTSHGVRRAYVNLLQQQRRYVNETKFDGGYSGVAYTTPDGDIPIVLDRMAPRGTMWFLNEKEITLYRDADWDWMTYGGSDRWKQVHLDGDDFDAYMARLFQYSELGTTRRNTHAKIEDLVEQ